MCTIWTVVQGGATVTKTRATVSQKMPLCQGVFKSNQNKFPGDIFVKFQ